MKMRFLWLSLAFAACANPMQFEENTTTCWNGGSVFDAFELDFVAYRSSERFVGWGYIYFEANYSEIYLVGIAKADSAFFTLEANEQEIAFRGKMAGNKIKGVFSGMTYKDQPLELTKQNCGL